MAIADGGWKIALAYYADGHEWMATADLDGSPQYDAMGPNPLAAMTVLAEELCRAIERRDTP